MKLKSQPRFNSARAFFQKWPLTNRTGRLTALVVVAIAAAAITLASISLAQTEKRIVRSDPAKSANSVPVPGKSSPARSTSIESKRGASRNAQKDQDRGLQGSQEREGRRRERMRPDARPKEWRLVRARPFRGDLRQLPQISPVKVERPEREEPELDPQIFVPPGGTPGAEEPSAPLAPIVGPSAPAPPPSGNFEGLSFGANGNGHPPDTNGDVGPTYYIQTINTSIGIFDKATGNLITAPTFNAFMSAGNFGNLCDTNNFGDPVVLYDSFEDRWIITDFAFQLSGGSVVNPPGAYQCFAVSQSGDPVVGGWNYYSLHITDFLNDYPKFGIWPDGIYMAANMFGFAAGGAYAGPRVWALNKAQMYAGAPTIQSVSFDGPASDFTLLPSNARLQTGTPPPGTPNYFLSTWQFLNAVTVYKFHVDWDHLSLSTFTGPDVPIAASSWPNQGVANAQSLGGNNLDVLQIRAMMQNQYSNLSGVESLWATHTVRRALNGLAAPRFYQVLVTGGTVAASITQAATFDPDGANVISRFMPSLAIDRAGNMALGYSTSNSTSKPAIKYAGRLATDPINTFSQTEQLLIQGAGTQTGNCGGSPCLRWGDYSAMTLDPDGCTFWYTNMYYPVDGLDHHTRIGSFTLPQCTTIGNGSVQGTVTSTSGGVPINGATVALGSRTATTDPSGFYSFSNIPAGTYPSITASFPGYSSATVISLVVNEGAITSQNFALSPGANDGCFTDTSQTDFQAGVPTNVDLTTSPGDVILFKPSLDQQNTTLGNSGFGINTTQWIGQTFMPAVTGTLTKLDISLFCATCSGANPAVTIDIRTTSGGLPTSTVLASTTIPGFSSGAAVYYTATFGIPPSLTAGTSYAIMARLVTPRSAGSYNATFSAANPYSRGALVFTVNGGTTWGTIAGDDLGFRTYMNTGFAPSGNLVSGTKDANPHTGGAVTWTTLSWNASTPAGTTLLFQVAGSNNAGGPFNFLGPDGTPATLFTTSGASLAQFNGLRYLKYQAFLNTSDGTVTPTLNDVTVCFSNTVPTTLATSSASGTYGGTANLSATLTDGVSPLSGKILNFSLNGNGVGSAVTDGSGGASLPNASLAGINAGDYPTGVSASFAGDPPYLSSNATNSLHVDKAPLSVKADDKTRQQCAPDPPFTVTYTGFVSGEGPGVLGGTLSFATPGASSEVVGPYPIIPSGLTSSNYDITFVNGVLTITPQFTTFGPTTVWVGLKNSDDVGTKFDLLAEVLKNGSVVGSGQINGEAGGSSGFNNAIQDVISQTLSGSPNFCGGATLSIRLSVRVAANSGHVSGTARLWYNDGQANSRFTATINGVPTTYYLRNVSNNLVLATGTGPTKFTIDVLVNRNQNGNPFKPFGTWNITF